MAEYTSPASSLLAAPASPVGVGVAAVIADGGRVLLVRRARAPAEGLWAFPGGRLEQGESLADGVRREVREECGLDVEVGELMDLVEVLEQQPDRLHHWVLAMYAARVRGGSLTPGDDALDARWVSLDELERLPTPPRVADLARRALMPG
jgi:mutator protein MutT